MCGRYTQTKHRGKFESRFAQELLMVDFIPRFNIAPTQMASVLVVENGALTQKEMRWGVPPIWAKEAKRPPIITAMCETIAIKPPFRKPFAQRRCLIPADGFYEWQTIGLGDASKGEL
jgi:putative SOS response-associated peptidase YedK